MEGPDAGDLEEALVIGIAAVADWARRGTALGTA